MNFSRLLVAFASFALAAPVAAADPDFSPETFRSHVVFLGDDLLEGRETGTRGYDIAARYVASQFEGLGLRPGTASGWFQPIDFLRYSSAAGAKLSVGGRDYLHGREIMVRANPAAEPGRLSAPVVFAGYGLDLPAQGFDDYAGLDVRGKIVVVLSGVPVGTPSDVAAHLNSEKARMASDRGAVGMLIVRTRGEDESTPWARLAQYADRPGTTWVGRDGRPFASHGLRFSATVDRPVALALFSGERRSLDRILLEASRQGGRPRGFELRQAATFEQGAGERTPISSANVVAILPGTDPALANEYVLLMAHLDGLGTDAPGSASDTAAAERPADRVRNGAMDNATGVATLIEVARQMTRDGNRPRRPILFAAVTAEEVGLLGASFLAQNPVVDGRVVAVVNLDMPILTYDFSDVTAFGAEHSTLGPIVERAAARMNVRLSPDPLPQEGLFTRSDHYRFVQRGIPSVFLMTGFAGEGRERFTSFLRDTYHSPRDDLSLPFDWQAGAKFAQLNYLIAREIADSPQAPLWFSDSFFAAAVAGDQPGATRGPAQAAR